MALTNGFQLPFGIQPVNPVPVDSWSGPYTGGTISEALTSANTSIPSAIRFQSMEVRIIVGGQSYKYWYRDGITDSNLVEFASTSSGISGPYVTFVNGFSGGITFAAGSGITFTQSNGIITLAATGETTVTGATGATGATGSTGSEGQGYTALGLSGDELWVSTVVAGIRGASYSLGYVRGNTGATGAPGVSGGTGFRGGVDFTFESTTTTANFNAGEVRFNAVSSNLPSVTQVYMSEETSGNVGITAWYETFNNSTSANKGTLLFQLREAIVSSFQFVLFNVTGNVTANTGYYTIPVSYLSGSWSSTNDEKSIVASFSANGNVGTTGTTGTTGATGNSGNTGSEGQGYTALGLSGGELWVSTVVAGIRGASYSLGYVRGNTGNTGNDGIRGATGATGPGGGGTTLFAGTGITLSTSASGTTVSTILGMTSATDGFLISGGDTKRTLGVCGGDVTIVGSGSPVVIDFPTVSTTLVGVHNTVSGISGATGDIGLVAGTNVTITQSGRTFTIASSGGGGTPAGSAGYVQYYSASGFSADNGLVYDSSNESLRIGSTGRYINLYTSGANSFVQGNGASTLYIQHTQPVYVGDGIQSGNGTYVLVDDVNQLITLNSPAVSINGNVTAPNIVNGISGATGNIGLLAGSNVTISQSGRTFTISSSGSGTPGATGPTGPTDIQSTNANLTFYPLFATGTGNTAIYIDNVTTPFSYTPSSGTLRLRTLSATAANGNSISVDPSATPPAVLMVNNANSDSLTLSTSGIAIDNRISDGAFTISTAIGASATDLYLKSDRIGFSDITGNFIYYFPNVLGSSGQALLTRTDGELYWGTVTSSGGGGTTLFAGTGITLTTSAAGTTVSTILGMTSAPDGFLISGGDTKRTLGICGGDVTIVGSGTGVTIDFPTVSTTLVGVHNTVSSINGFTGGVTFAQGTNVTITSVGNIITINSSGSGSGTSGVSTYDGRTGDVVTPPLILYALGII